MALTPYRQQVGVPREAGGGVSDIADTRIQDVSGSLNSLSKQLLATAAPLLEAEAIEKAQTNAGAMVLSRDAEGRLVAPERTDEGGIIYQQAFDKVMQARYLSDVGSDFQKFLDNDMALRRTGQKKFDAAEYAATVSAYKDGMLEGVPAWLRAETEELFTREANERTRAFTNEVSRSNQINLINGTLKLVTEYREKLKDRDGLVREALASGRSAEQVADDYKVKSLALIETLADKNFAGDEEVKAMVLGLDDQIEDVGNYFAGKALLAQYAPSIMQMDAAARRQVILALSGVDITENGVITGTVRSRTGTSEVVTGDLLVGATKEIFGVDATSGPRGPDHPLSIKARQLGYISTHDTSGPGGGRAIDMPRIEGKKIEDAVAMWRAAGYNVTKWRDEYKDPSAAATGPHWHFEFGNKREVVTETKGPIEGLTVDMLMTQDPANKRVWLEMLTEAEQQERFLEGQRREDARNDARIRAEQNKEANLRENIQLKVSMGLGGALSNEERDLADADSLRTIDYGNLHTPQERGKLLEHVKRYGDVPRTAQSWMQNKIRSNEWAQAFEFYDNVKNTRIGQNGAMMGDRLLSGLDTRSVALFGYAEQLYRNGESVQKIGDALTLAVKGQGFTPEQAITNYNLEKGEEGDMTPFDKNLREQTVAALGLPTVSASRLPPQMLADIKASFAINYELYRNPDVALQTSIKQAGKSYRKSSLFVGDIGPVGLFNMFGDEAVNKVRDFFVTEKTETGQWLLPTGMRHRFGGPNPSVRLTAIDNQVQGVGEYKVTITDPANTAVVLDSYTIDLGRYLTDFYRTGDAAVGVDNRQQQEANLKRAREAAARAQGLQSGAAKTADEARQRLPRGPKY